MEIGAGVSQGQARLWLESCAQTQRCGPADVDLELVAGQLLEWATECAAGYKVSLQFGPQGLPEGRQADLAPSQVEESGDVEMDDPKRLRTGLWC